MSPELDRILCRRYPFIFSERNLSGSCMGRGFECGDGWFDIIDALCESIQCLIDDEGLPQVGATQVKEKIGALRFRVNRSGPEIRGVIRMAESMSRRICDLCGKSKSGAMAIPKRWLLNDRRSCSCASSPALD